MSEPLVVLARIGRPHGVAGTMHVDVAGDHLRDFLKKSLLLCTSPQLTGILSEYDIKAELNLIQIEPTKGQVSRVRFEGISDRDSAAALTNYLIAAHLKTMRQNVQNTRTQKDIQLSELWYFEIVGLAVYDAATHVEIGHITGIEDMGLNTIVTIEPGKSQNSLLRSIEIPLDYPHWGQVDLQQNKILLAEWGIFIQT